MKSYSMTTLCEEKFKTCKDSMIKATFIPQLPSGDEIQEGGMVLDGVSRLFFKVGRNLHATQRLHQAWFYRKWEN